MGRFYDIPRFERRVYEILPGTLTWIVLIGPLILTIYAPLWLAYMVILFDLYWLFRSVKLSKALLTAYTELRKNIVVDWWSKVRRTKMPYNEYYQAIIIPYYNEEPELIEEAIKSVQYARYLHHNIIIVLAVEERGGPDVLKHALHFQEKYRTIFNECIVSVHPDDIEGEAKAKGANITRAAKELKQYLDQKSISYEKTLVISVDSDARIHPQLLAELLYRFLHTENPHNHLFQFIPMYHNNLWDAKSMMRIIATSCSFWTLIESTRPKRLRTFACYAMSFRNLLECDYWDVTSIIEDGVQYWRNLIVHDGKQGVKIVYSPVYQNAVIGKTTWDTYKGQYIQLRRWAWGASDISIVVPQFKRNKQIKWSERFIQTYRLYENHISWATAPLILLFGGWAPLMNKHFYENVFAHNLPIATSTILTLAMLGISISIIISILLLPKDPYRSKWYVKTFHAAEWVLAPLITIIFGAIPAIDAQTRLALGKRLEFIVTPKGSKK